MAYSTVPRVIQDAAVGFQTFNQLRDNLEALYAAWTAEHGANDILPAAAGYSSANFHDFGLHDHISIPRCVVNVRVSSGPYYVAWTELGNSVVGIPLVVDTGVMFIRFTALGANSWVEPQAVQSGTDLRIANARIVTSFGGSNTGGILVNTYELAAGDMVPTTFGFSLFIYSE